MKTFLLLLYFVVCVSLPCRVQCQATGKLPGTASFSFTLQQQAATSAGVFTRDGTLIKTLWSNVTYLPGTHTEKWDGNNDEGRLAPNDDYTIKVLSNNVRYTWEGVIGNTSKAKTGQSVYHGYERMYGMAVAGDTAYCARGYNEQAPSPVKFALSNPQEKIGMLSAGRSTGQKSKLVATDGNNVYWAGNDPFNETYSFVFASRTSDDAQTVFSAGTAYTTAWGTAYASVVDAVDNPGLAITGLAVQKTGDYLVVSHKELNEIHILNKRTGALVNIERMEAPQSLAADDNGNLWILHTANGKPMAEKFKINFNGTITAQHLSINTLVDPLAISVSPDNATVVIADGGSSQQLKAFAHSSAVPVWVFGQQGGYANDPAVTNDKFYFNDVSNRIRGTFIAFAPDGSFWVEDAGNARTQHYSAGRQFVESIMYLPCSRSSHCDPNNPTRVFSDYLEFSVDYTKPLAPNNESWKLVKNWGFTMPDSWDNEFNRLKSVVTLRNGHTYAVQQSQSAPYNWQLVELPSSGPLRFTGVMQNNDNTLLYPDGSLRKVTSYREGQSSSFTTKPLLGFDNSNNPRWGAEETAASTPAATSSDPVYRGMVGWASPSADITSSNIVVSFEGGLKPPYGSEGHHLGGIRLGDNKWLWKTARSTGINYEGGYPIDGAYDTGNGAGYLGGIVTSSGRNIFWSYHGEGWKQSQTNKWQHVYDDGLLVGVFGVTGTEVAEQEAPPQMAGNVLSGSLVKDADGNLYLYHCDESYHSGIHRWKIDGLETIQEQTIAVTLSGGGEGLLGQYFEGAELNNFNIKTTRIDSVVNFLTAAEVLQNTNIGSQENFSAKWTGYVKPLYSETYTFYTAATGGLRLWMDGRLLMDHAKNSVVSDSATVGLIAGEQYAIRLEYYNYKGPASVSLSWASLSQQKQPVPKTQLIPDEAPDRTNGTDLLEDLPRDGTLEDGRYGWRRYPADDGDTANRWVNYWSAATNKRSYQNGPPDLYALFRRENNTGSTLWAAVTRDLGSVTYSLARWSLNGSINYDGTDPNFDPYDLTVSGQSGATLDVLDDKGKIITRMFPHASVSGGEWKGSLYANDQTIVETSYNNFRPVISKSQPLAITMKDGVATFRYGQYNAVSTGVYDPGSDWHRPKTLRLYFWTNVPWSHNDRVIDIPSMRFLSATDSVGQVLPLRLLSFKATRSDGGVTIYWSTAGEVNTKVFIVERSADGSHFYSIGAVDAHNTNAAGYAFVDGAPYNGANYYRLKIIERDGSFWYSSVIAVATKGSKIFIYPNPAGSVLHLGHLSESGSALVEIISPDGKLIKTYTPATNGTETSIDLRSLQKGLYFVKCNNTTYQFVKQ